MAATTSAPPSPAPRAGQVRARLRRARRRHHDTSLGDVLTDVYVVVLFVAMYGWFALTGIRRYLDSPAGAPGDPGERYWIAVAAALAATGLAWRLLRAAGPLLVTPAAQSWLFSAPVDRAALLLPRAAALAGTTALGAGLLGLGAAVAGGPDRPIDLLWSALAGAACGTLAVAGAVVAQAAPRDPRWARLVDRVLLGSAGAVALLVVAGHLLDRPVPPLSLALTAAVAVVGVPVAGWAVRWAYRALGGVDRASLISGGQFAGAATSAAVLLDPSMIEDLVQSRRWRAIGRVPGRPLRRGGRFAVLVRAEARRLRRHPSALPVWAALLLAMYAAAVALPASAGSWQVVLGYLAVDRLTGGLRTISRSAGLRRTLGGSDTELRLAHVVLPAVGALVWYAATLPVVRPTVGPVDGLLLAGIVAAAYRSATRPPMRYDGPIVDTPFAMIPVDLVRRVVRGPDLVAVLVLVQLLLT
ncbi:DUF6297 family protein [Micromonospora siamensis]|uniref:ABC-2 type transport system permease protein n=1 Tax=Micromonospora siamensis TaxID=299152 RepID=A0A1C5HDE8_9ACTN|nr:DUF6297 family protein [Micromonospora siamensis]SCG44069.1 hypothetical protein GA0074704_1525 [Micromonospora siamensis]